MYCSSRAGGLCIFVMTCCAGAASAAPGSIVMTFPWSAKDYLQDPTRPVIYASVSNQNAIAVVNTQTLAYQLVPIGANPLGMALSPDASKLYVANSGSTSIGVMDTATLAALNPIPIPSGAHPVDVAFGNNNRLFALAGNIQQIDASTGATAGPTPPGIFYFGGGTLEISPDRNTLYYGEEALSPTTLYKIDASTTALNVTQSTHTGSNGRDVVLSHSGSIVAQPNGAPYVIGLMSASDLSVLGWLDTGSYPYELAFSPDDKVAYAYVQGVGIKTFDTSSFLSIGPDIAGIGYDMFVDPMGKYLFASSDVATTVYDTGRIVPEPATLSLLALVAGSLALRPRRKR